MSEKFPTHYSSFTLCTCKHKATEIAVLFPNHYMFPPASFCTLVIGGHCFISQLWNRIIRMILFNKDALCPGISIISQRDTFFSCFWNIKNSWSLLIFDSYRLTVLLGYKKNSKYSRPPPSFSNVTHTLQPQDLSTWCGSAWYSLPPHSCMASSVSSFRSLLKSAPSQWGPSLKFWPHFPRTLRFIFPSLPCFSLAVITNTNYILPGYLGSSRLHEGRGFSLFCSLLYS